LSVFVLNIHKNADNETYSDGYVPSLIQGDFDYGLLTSKLSGKAGTPISGLLMSRCVPGCIQKVPGLSQ